MKQCVREEFCESHVEEESPKPVEIKGCIHGGDGIEVSCMEAILIDLYLNTKTQA